MADLVEMAKKGNGYISSAQVTSAGIPGGCQPMLSHPASPSRWSAACTPCPAPGRTSRISRNTGSPGGIFSNETVLYLHGMTGRAPFSPTMTLPRSYNAKSAREAGIVCRTHAPTTCWALADARQTPSRYHQDS